MADGWGTGKGDVEEERNQIMQKIFGDESGEEVVEEEDPEDYQAHDRDGATSGGDRGSGGGRGGLGQKQNRRLASPAAEVVEEEEYELDNGHDGDQREEGQGESQGSSGMAQEIEVDSHDVELGNQNTQVHAKGVDRAEGGHVKRTVTSETRSTEDEEHHEVLHDAFDDNDEDELAPYGSQDDNEHAHESLMNDVGHYEGLQPEDMVDEDKHYEPDENIEHELKDKPHGPPLNLVVPRMLPPGQPDRILLRSYSGSLQIKSTISLMNVIKVSNIMGINPKPFDPETYVEEDASMTDESGGRKKIRLEDNIVRWKIVKNTDGTESYESNARFVKWKDGSIQLLIGNEVLDISVNDSNHDKSHLFLRNGKAIIQSLHLPLLSIDHHHVHKLTIGVFLGASAITRKASTEDEKTIKMQTWIDENDPERVKEEREKAEGENIRASSSLQRKREQVKRKYSQPLRQRQKLTPGFLEDALEEDEAPGVGNQRRGPGRAHFEDDLEAEALSKRHVTNVKKANVGKAVPSPSVHKHQVNEYSDSEREESEYETDGEDIDNSPTNGREDELDEEEEEDPEEVIGDTSMSDENHEEQEHVKERKGFDSDDESPPRKKPLNRRKTVVFDSDDE
uniref:Leo1-like protein n=1 Tax=Oryza punctata TaxID=4537 RepID=A0A0E0KJ72_ORYPU